MSAVRMRELSGLAGRPCTKCSRAWETKRVVVEAGQEIVIAGRPFFVSVDEVFFMCLRCRSFYLSEDVVPSKTG
jgi:hypothetical protein